MSDDLFEDQIPPHAPGDPRQQSEIEADAAKAAAAKAKAAKPAPADPATA